MAQALKDSYGPAIPEWIADRIAAVHPGFDRQAFIADALDGYGDLELTARARRMADALWRALPGGFTHVADVLTRSLGPEIDADTIDGNGMDPFRYLPHVFLVAEHGMEDFDAAMALQRELTRRFTAEFSIRVFIEAEPERTLATLGEWTRDPSPHVRRLVSEGTRTRLPWAPRLRSVQRDPTPILPLLEALRDDPAEYVRRSVANNLNDLAKDHPDLVLRIARDWMADAPPERRRLVRHALRTLSRAGDPEALAILGFGDADGLSVEGLEVEPPAPRIGARVVVTCRVTNTGPGSASVLVHLRVHFVKARGTSPKTFLMAERDLAAGASFTARKSVSVQQHSTRTHRPGEHRVEVLVNGAPRADGAFLLRP